MPNEAAIPKVVEVNDLDDPRLADYRHLNEPGFRARHEAATGTFIVESPEPFRTVLRSNARELVRSVFLTPAQLDALAPELDVVPNAPIYVGSQDLLRAVIGFDLHRGVLACATRPNGAAVDDVIASARLVLVCERLNDAENLGVIFRSAAGLGVDAVILDPECSDPWYRRTVRVSIGHVTTVPWARAAAWPATLVRLRDLGFAIAALTPHINAVTIEEYASSAPSRVALVVGAEGPGLSAATISLADAAVRIPMRRGVDSLNVATAAAIAMHRLAR